MYNVYVPAERMVGIWIGKHNKPAEPINFIADCIIAIFQRKWGNQTSHITHTNSLTGLPYISISFQCSNV